MKQDYLQNILDVCELCQKLRKFVIEKRYYEEDGSLARRGRKGVFCFFPVYRNRFEPVRGAVAICDLLGIRSLEKAKPVVDIRIRHLEDNLRLQRSKYWFDKSLEVIEKVFKRAMSEIEKRISLLDSEEKNRLNESIHSFLEGCYYSAIAMSVSAIEFRLFSLMMSVNPDPKLKELTLGQLIREYLDNKKKYDNIIPKKHEPLLEHCNVYRVFSVHPKKEEINKPIANSILSMTFMFLLDKKLTAKKKPIGRKIKKVAKTRKN